MKIYDLSHTIMSNMQVYPGDPSVVIKESLNHDNDYCHVDSLIMGSHTGTHIDAPYHFIKNGKKITDYKIDKFIGSGVIFDVTSKIEADPITLGDITDYKDLINKGDFVIFMSGYFKKYGTKEYLTHPYIDKEVAQYLVDVGISIVGVDFLNVDPTHFELWEAHNIFLSNDVLIVENLTNLNQLNAKQRYTFFFLPLKVKGSDGSPVRAVAISTAEAKNE